MQHCISLRYTGCYFNTLIYGNMIASVVIFVTLHNDSTKLLSIFIILCIISMAYLLLVTVILLNKQTLAEH